MDSTDRLVKHLLTISEHEMLDFKRVGNVKSILKTACAMANGDGGDIVLGLGDARHGVGEERLYGIEENAEAVGDVKRAFIEEISPPLTLPEAEKPLFSEVPVKKTDGSIVVLIFISVAKSNSVHSYNNATYIRSGSQNRQIGAQEIHRLCLRRGVESIVDQPVDVPAELLDTVWWEQYSHERRLTRSLPEALKHLGLMKKEGEVWNPTVAAVLLFAEEPNGLLGKKCSIRIFHYRGHVIEYGEDPNLLRKPVTVSGSVLKQIRDAVDIVGRELNSGLQRTTKGFELQQEYPLKVVQEAITNAVLHRDYSISGDILIRIFTNRIEIESPGSFPGAVTSDNIGKIGSRPRNPRLTDHVREFPNPPNLDAGEGVRMMRMTLDSMGFYPPVFEENTGKNNECVLVRISNEAKLSEWELVKDFLDKHDSIVNKDLRTILNLPETEKYKASRLLKGWVESGLLRIVNPSEGTRNRKYALSSAGLLTSGQLDINGNESYASLIGKGIWNTMVAMEDAKRPKR